MQRGHIRLAVASDLSEILALLSAVRLPTAGVGDHLENFLVLEVDGRVAGTVGLELYGREALLRSLAVTPERQGRGWGSALSQAIVERAESLSVEEIILLTETADGFFQKQGFRTIARDEVSDAMKTSVEFTSCCPLSAVCMKRRVAAA